MHRSIISLVSALFAAAFLISGCGCPKGLYVEGGKFYKDRKPVYAIGANYYSLFNRTFENRSDTSGLHGLGVLAGHGVPFVRFAACVYYPNEMRDYLVKDSVAYWNNMDAIVRRAEKEGIGLIPSFFWSIPAVPDYFGEHMDAFADDSSLTMKFIRRYVQEMVVRYKDSPAIWGWEYGNECSLSVDNPALGGGSIPSCVPSMGTPEVRDSTRDVYREECMLNSMKNFRETIRKYDKTRPIFTGNDVPRYCAWHNVHTATPYVMDTPEQNHEMVRLYEREADTYTGRGYYNYADKGTPNYDPMQYYNMGLKEWPDFIKVLKKWSDEDGKPLFVGEFGIQDWWLKDPEPGTWQCWTRKPDVKAEFKKRVDAIVDNDIQLSAYWVYDFPPQDSFTNSTFDNSRSYMLDMIIDGNKEFKAKHPLK